MTREGFIGLVVHLTRDRTIPFENPFSGEVSEEAGTRYTTSDEFVVEHDFRGSGKRDGIQVCCPPATAGTRGSWMALTSEQSEEMFGGDALRVLELMRGA